MAIERWCGIWVRGSGCVQARAHTGAHVSRDQAMLAERDAEIERLRGAVEDIHRACTDLEASGTVAACRAGHIALRALAAATARAENLQEAIDLTFWMAERWAEGGGARGPEMYDLDQARAALAAAAPGDGGEGA